MSTRRVEVMCVVCRDGLDAGSQTCLACGALYHEDCLAGLRGRCATLGCPALRPAQATPPSGRPARLVLSAAQVAAAAPVRSPRRAVEGDDELPVVGCVVVLVGIAAALVLWNPALVQNQERAEEALYLGGAAVSVMLYVGKWLLELWTPKGRLAPPSPPSLVVTPAAGGPGPVGLLSGATAAPPRLASTGTCALCQAPSQVGRPVCRDHAALLDDQLGPTVRVRPRPGQLYGPGLVDEGLSRRPG